MADWIDDLLRERLGRAVISEPANQLIREMIERARAALGSDPPDPGVQADFNLFINYLITEGRRGQFERRDQRGSVAGGPVIDEFVVLSAKRGFCPKWPWC